MQQPALVATCLAIDAALRARGIAPDYVVGHSVGEFSALGAAGSFGVSEAIALVRERGLAMAEAAKERPGSMAAILGLADEAVEALCKKISNVWPANYNCPGQLVISGETTRSTRPASRRRPRARAARSSFVSRARSTRRSSSARPSGCGRRSSGSHLQGRGSVHVDRDGAVSKTRSATASCSIEQLTAPVKFTQAARELVGQGVTTFVEVGPGNVLGGLLKRIDSSVRTLSVNDLESLDEATEALG